MSRCRFFLGDSSTRFHVLTFDQKPDASIYIFPTTPQEFIWQGIDKDLGLVQCQGNPDEKLSVHGSGVSHIRRGKNGATCFRYDGMYLKDDEAKLLGIRHVASLLLGKPSYVPASPAGARRSDVLLSRSVLSPNAFLFFAVPLQQKKLGATIGIDKEDLPERKEFQWGSFNLRFHRLVWCYYMTRHMSAWPAHTYLCSLDGMHVPLFIGGPPSAARIDVRIPLISWNGDELWLGVV